MTHDEFNQFCLSFKQVTYVMQWGDSHVWKVGGKVFAIGTKNKVGEPAFTFKTSDINYHFLSEAPGYIPAPYMASRGMKWIQQNNVFDAQESKQAKSDGISEKSRDEELRYYISESYRLVTLGLTKKKQKELGLLKNV